MRDCQGLGGVGAIMPAGRLLTRAHEIADGSATLPPLTSRYTRIAPTQGLRRLIEADHGYMVWRWKASVLLMLPGAWRRRADARINRRKAPSSRCTGRQRHGL